MLGCVRVLLCALMLATGLSFTVSPVAAEPGAPVVRNSRETLVADQYIVVLHDNVENVADVAHALVDRFDGTLLYVYENALKGFSASLTSTAINSLRHDPAVAWIEQDIVAETRETKTQTGAPWGLDRIDQRDLPLSSTYTYEQTGAGVNIYILDSGIRTTHAEFGGRASYAAGQCNPSTTDDYGHGTHVAGIAGGATYGVAKQANLIAVTNFGCDGGTAGSVIAGVDWITANHVKPAVVNMSFGWSLTSGQPKTAVEIAIENSIDAGVVYVGATDNNFVDSCADFPSRIDGVITVSNATSADVMGAFTAWGPCVDVFGPGANIPAAAITSDTDITQMSGTSMATPHVAGVAALFLEAHPTATPAEVFDFIVNSATVGRLTRGGSTTLPNGTPNRLLYITPNVINSVPSAGGIYRIAEGDSLTLTATVADPAPGGTLGWDLNDDDDFSDASGANPTLTWAQLNVLGIDNGPHSYSIRVRYSDGTVVIDSPRSGLSISNVAPTVTSPVDQTADVNISTSLMLGSVVDPGLEGTWDVSVDWGDGSPDTTFTVSEPGTIPAQLHTYTAMGSYTVNILVEDDVASGSASFLVTVTDSTPPTLADPIPDVTVPATSPAGAAVTFSLPGATDNSPDVSVSCDPPSGSLFSVGTTPVTCTATDGGGLTDSGSFTVTVIGAADLLAQLQADTATEVSSPILKRMMLANLQMTRMMLTHGNPQHARMMLRAYEVQVRIAEATRMLSPTIAQQLIADARIVADALT